MAPSPRALVPALGRDLGGPVHAPPASPTEALPHLPVSYGHDGGCWSALASATEPRAASATYPASATSPASATDPASCIGGYAPSRLADGESVPPTMPLRA